MRLALSKPVGHFLISNWWGWIRPFGGGANPGLVGLGSVRNMAEEAMKNMTSASAPVSRFLPCVSPCHGYLP